jgi:hypothetical protein
MSNVHSWYEVDFVPEMNKAITNINSLGKKMLPRAARSSTNKMARAITKNTQKKAAAQLKIPTTVLKYHEHKAAPGKKKPRFTLLLSGKKRTEAIIKMGRTAIPVVRLISNPAKQDTRLKVMRKRKSIKAGKHVYPGAFVAAGVTPSSKGVLKGRYQVMKRTGKSRYPLEVIKLETKTAVTRHAIRETRTELRQNSGKLLAAALLAEAKKEILR